MPKRKKSFIEELKRRKVFKAFNSWGILLIGSFTVMEPVSVALNLGEGLQRAFMALVFLTLPVFLVFSWVFEEGADGELEVTDELDEEAGAPRSASGGGVGSIVVAVVIVALIGVFVANPGGISTRFTSLLSSRFFSGVTVEPGLGGSIVEGGYEVGSDLTVSFTGPVDPTTASSENIRIVNADDEVIPATVSVDFGGSAVVLNPRAPLTYGADYTIEISSSLRGADGKPVWDAEKTGPGARIAFSTQPIPADGVRPRATLASDLDPERIPAAGPITLEFDDAVDRSTLETGIVLRTADGTEVETEMLLSADSREVRIEPASSLDRGGRYLLSVDSTLLASTGLAAIPTTLELRVIPPAPRPSVSQGRPEVTPPASTTGPGRLTLNISPAAAVPFLKVFVDGSEVGLPVSGLEIAESRSHRIRIEGVPDLSGYSMTVWEQTVTPTPGQRLSIDAAITPFGSIDITTDPVGIVFLDGVEVGRTPLSGWPIEAGRLMKLEVRPLPADADRYEPFCGDVRVSSLEWRTIPRTPLPPAGAETRCER